MPPAIRATATVHLEQSAPCAVLARHLEELAIRARSSAEQSLLISEGLHEELPALLARPLPGGSPTATWRMKAQAARLLANLAYQPAHKGVIVNSGGLQALTDAAGEALPFSFSNSEGSVAASALLLEAAAAIGNLASGADARRSVAMASPRPPISSPACLPCTWAWHRQLSRRQRHLPWRWRARRRARSRTCHSAARHTCGS